MIDVFVRLDDVLRDPPQEEKCILRLRDIGLKSSLQVVPTDVTPSGAAWLLQLKAELGEWVSISQHGYSHLNHGHTHDHEFGPSRSYSEQLNDVRQGQRLLEDALGEGLFPAFTPPFNAYDANTLRACRDAGVLVFSHDTCGILRRDRGMLEVPINIDTIIDYEDASVYSDAAVTHELFRRGYGGQFVGVMLHPWITKDRTDVAISALAQFVSNVPYSAVTLSDLWRRDRDV